MTSLRGSAIERARQDVAEGRRWKARDRLLGYLAADPSNREALDLLGEIWQAMGDAPNAGAAWFLVGRDDADSRAAYEALEQRTGRDPGLFLRALPLKGPLEGFPDEVQARIHQLAAEAAARGSLSRQTRHRLEPRTGPSPELPSRSLAGRVAGTAGCLIGLAVGAFFVVGLVIGVGLEASVVLVALRSWGIDTNLALYVLFAVLLLLVLTRALLRRVRG